MCVCLFRVIFCEAIAIYGVIVSIMLSGKPGDWKWNTDNASLVGSEREVMFHVAKKNALLTRKSWMLNKANTRETWELWVTNPNAEKCGKAGEGEKVDAEKENPRAP